MSGEHFIPFRKADVVSMCADDLPASERESFLGFTRMLASLLHHRFHARIEALKEAYEPFNLEADTRSVAPLGRDARLAARRRVEEELTALAQAANFTQLDAAELDAAFSKHSLLKVKMAIDLDVIDQLLLFRRGESVRTRQVRIWYGLRKQTVTFTNYARVLVYATFKDDLTGKDTPFEPGSMIIKLFQNVPREDLEMIFPNVQVRMRPVDKLLIGIPAVISGIIVIATKLLASLGLLLLLLGFWVGLREKPDIDETRLLTIGAG